MSETIISDGACESEKPAHNEVKFPPFPDPSGEDFDDNVSEADRSYYKEKFKDLNTIKRYKLHCTSCDRHLGCSPLNERIRVHPMLRTLVCHSCHNFYNSGEFEKGDDGSELYCRWCGQGGQVYCCSDCPHVFCAKCIRRNFGVTKIKEIENADDWKCFKCKPECLKDLRALCWAVLRFCDLKQKITSMTKDPDLKAAYENDCALDLSECCKHKTTKKNQKLNESYTKKKEVKKELETNKIATNLLSKITPSIQVKKFASVNVEDTSKAEKKPQKRAASPKLKSHMVKNPISIAPCPKLISPIGVPPLAKKIKLPNCTVNSTIRFPNVQDRKGLNTYSRIRPKLYNGFTGIMFSNVNNTINDNINLSLESLTQGLDMAAVAAFSANTQQQDDDVVCTPDFPMEPLCEVTEDNDDDVQCITPVATAVSKTANPPPPPMVAIPRVVTNVTDINPENIIQMTENDVTVNESTGGLKFRVDPQTLSSNKMYRLPDGRIFAINANPNMPGGYSATIVAVTETKKGLPKGATYAAKINPISNSASTPKTNRNSGNRTVNSKRTTAKNTKSTKTSEKLPRECDLNVPVEWYRYNLVDAIDALEYSLSRLQKLKKEATSVYLRTRSLPEMRSLHRTLEILLNTSSNRFNEIRDNLNKGLKDYSFKKVNGNASEDDDDDDVEILPDMDDDPIFIDENSTESNMNSENQEVDLTGPGSSECNDSSENRNDSLAKNDNDSLNVTPDKDAYKGKNLSNNDNFLDAVLGKNKNDAENGNEVNGGDNSMLVNDGLKCDESSVIKNITKESSNEDRKDENEITYSSKTNAIKRLEVKILDENTSESEDKILGLEKNPSESENKILGLDKNPSESEDKILGLDENPSESDDKILGIDEHSSESNDKILGIDEHPSESENTIFGLDESLLESDDKKQDGKNHVKSENINNKVQDVEMGEELLTTPLLNDSVNIATNSEVAAQQVT